MKRSAVLCAGLLAVAAACTRTVVVTTTPSPSTSLSAVAPPGSVFLQARGVRFAYPESWHVLAAGPPAGTGTLDLAVSPDDESFVRVKRFALSINVTPERLPDVKPQLARSLNETAARLGGTVIAPLAPTSTAGFPGYSARLRITTTKGNVGEENLYVFFDQTNEYTLACASTSVTSNDVSMACDLARTTFAARHPLAPASSGGASP